MHKRGAHYFIVFIEAFLYKLNFLCKYRRILYWNLSSYLVSQRKGEPNPLPRFRLKNQDSRILLKNKQKERYASTQ